MFSSSVHRSAAAALSTCNHFTDTPAVQFGRAGMANRNQQCWRYLAETARPQPWLRSAGGTRNARRSSQLCLAGKRRTVKTHKHACGTAGCTSQPSSLSTTPWSPVYTLQTRVLHMPCLDTGLTAAYASSQPKCEAS